MTVLYLTSDARRRRRKRRADRLKAAGVCVTAWSHGPATHGVRCYRCHVAHRGSK